MKKVVFLFLSIFYSLGIWSQESDVLVCEGKQWSVYSISSIGMDEKTMITLLKGDTVINDQVYKKVYYTFDRDLSNLKRENYCIRQDNKRIFFYYYLPQKEVLWFDFGLQEGDVFIFKDFFGSSDVIEHSATITAVSDVVFDKGDGVRRKCFTMKPSYTVMVEGIGSLHRGGSELMVGATGAGHQLLCCHNKNEMLYQNEEFESCFQATGTLEHTYHASYILENPVKNKLLTIELKDAEFFEMDIYSWDGKFLFTKDISISNGILEIPLMNLQAGSYILILSRKDGSRESTQIIVL